MKVFKRNVLLLSGTLILCLILIVTILSPLIIKYDPDTQNSPSQNQYQAPSSKHLFGTDKFGRDVFSRVLFGGRISLFIALSVVVFSIFIGCFYGAIAGYFGGILDQILMRFLDLFLSFPIIFLAITCMALFGTGIFMLIIVLTLTGWMDIARLVRAEVFSLKQQPFILKAKAAGLSNKRIIAIHLIPNVVITLVAFAIIRIVDIILLESALSFIGIGVQPPTASWGSLISEGKLVLDFAWWLTFFPGSAILLTTFSLNMIGNGIKKIRD
ncbi:MAG: ABC transporter permease [bacterium]|nr:ABC transporter permease [bacterium]